MSGDSAQGERRRSRRIPAAELPESLQTLYLQINEGEAFTAKTIDASTEGIGLLLPLPFFSIKDYNVTIQAKDASFTLNDELVYIKPVNNQSSRVSIWFTPCPELVKYSALLPAR